MGRGGPISLVLAPTLAPFPQTLPQARPLSRAAVLQLLARPAGLRAFHGGEERDGRSPAPPGGAACVSRAGTGHVTPISRPTSQKEDCDLGPGEQEGPSLPLRFRVDEQMLVSLLEAGWAAVGGMGPQPGRQSGCLNDA